MVNSKKLQFVPLSTVFGLSMAQTLEYYMYIGCSTLMYNCLPPICIKSIIFPQTQRCITYFLQQLSFADQFHNVSRATTSIVVTRRTQICFKSLSLPIIAAIHFVPSCRRMLSRDFALNFKRVFLIMNGPVCSFLFRVNSSRFVIRQDLGLG